MNVHERNQRIARVLHNDGIELTPDQVGEQIAAAIAVIRRRLAAHGCEFIPEQDDEAFEFLVRWYHHKQQRCDP